MYLLLPLVFEEADSWPNYTKPNLAFFQANCNAPHFQLSRLHLHSKFYIILGWGSEVDQASYGIIDLVVEQFEKRESNNNNRKKRINTPWCIYHIHIVYI